VNNALAFPFRMAGRELRRNRRKFLFFLLCIAVGVAGLVGVKGFNASLQSALLKEARTLMAADMTMSMSKLPTAEQAQIFHKLRAQGITVIRIVETTSMAVNPTSRDSQLVELKAVEPGYPFYGALELNPAGQLTDQTALVGGELLERLKLGVGDALRVGEATFTIAGVIVKEPDKVTAGFGLGPRVMVTAGGLARANLIQVGSRARYIHLFKLASDEQVEQVRTDLKAAFAPDKPRIADFREAQPQVKRFLDRMTSFLALVSMVALLVGGLGVANATRVFIQQKLDAIAIMKCVGATTRKVMQVYLTQMMLLSLAGSALGVAIGYAIQLIMPRVVGNILDLSLSFTLSPMVALQGITVGLLTSVLFTLLPLAAIADVKPALVFRREMAENRPPVTWLHRLRQAVPLAGIGVGLGFIAAWISGNLRWGFYFMGGLIGAVLLLGAASSGVVWLTRRIRLPRKWLTVRQGLANLHRPGSQTGAVVLALGVGVTMVLAVYLLQRSLMAEVNLTSPEGTPNMFFMGMGNQEVGEFHKLLKAQPGVDNAPEPVAMARARMIKIDGLTKERYAPGERAEWYFNSQFSLTLAEKVPEGNEVISGRWWTPADYSGKALASVDQEAAEELRLKVGSVLDIEIEGGVPLQAQVFSVRKSTDVRAGNFASFIFSPGSLDGAPVRYIAQARVQPGAFATVQRELVAKYPAITVINLNDVLETVTSVLDRIGLVIRFVAGFSVAAGLIILASSIAATKFRRTREAVLFKTLGATRGKVWRIFAMEYAALGLVAGVVGSGLAAVANWVVLTWVMDITYKLEVVPLLAGVGVTVLLTVAVGVISTMDVLAARPLEVLRQE